MLIVAIVVPAAVAAAGVVRWVAYLLFCAWLVHRHGPEALEDAANAARGFRHS